MAYSTHAQVQIAVGGPARLIELADLDNDGTEDTGVVDAAIATADAVIDSYTGHRYGVPLSPVPTVISALSSYWAARVLRRNRYNGQPMVDDNDQELVDREWLLKVAEGTISLGIEPTPAKASIVIDKAGERDSTKAVSRDRLRGAW